MLLVVACDGGGVRSGKMRNSYYSHLLMVSVVTYLSVRYDSGFMFRSYTLMPVW
jgi:hypothetical protein